MVSCQVGIAKIDWKRHTVFQTLSQPGGHFLLFLDLLPPFPLQPAFSRIVWYFFLEFLGRREVLRNARDGAFAAVLWCAI